MDQKNIFCGIESGAKADFSTWAFDSTLFSLIKARTCFAPLLTQSRIYFWSTFDFMGNLVLGSDSNCLQVDQKSFDSKVDFHPIRSFFHTLLWIKEYPDTWLIEYETYKKWHAPYLQNRKWISRRYSISRKSHFLSIQDEVLIQSLVLDPDNDPIRDQMIREFPDDVTTR